jgi:hypothetical protein
MSAAYRNAFTAPAKVDVNINDSSIWLKKSPARGRGKSHVEKRRALATVSMLPQPAGGYKGSFDAIQRALCGT